MVNIYDKLWDIPRYLLSTPCSYVVLQRMRCTCSFPLFSSPSYYLKIFLLFINLPAFFFSQMLAGLGFFFQRWYITDNFITQNLPFAYPWLPMQLPPFPPGYLRLCYTRKPGTGTLKTRRFRGDDPWPSLFTGSLGNKHHFRNKEFCR